MNFTWLGALTGAVFLCSCYKGFSRGLVKEIISFISVFAAMALVWVVNPHVEEFLENNTGVYPYIEEQINDSFEKNFPEIHQQEEQDDYVEELQLPQFLKKNILQNNNAETYKIMSVYSFGDYIKEYLIKVLKSIVSFLLSFILIIVLLKVSGSILEILVSFPVLKQTNKIAGAVLGGGKCLVFIWVLLMAFTVCAQTEWGKMGIELIEKDLIMKSLYDNNLLMKLLLEGM